MPSLHRPLCIALSVLALAGAACSDHPAEPQMKSSANSSNTTYDATIGSRGVEINRASPGGARDPLGLMPQDEFAPGSVSRGPNIDQPD